jgi:hypothetical protein
MADSDGLRAKRARAHRNGDHSLCRPENCPKAGQTVDNTPLPPDVQELVDALDKELVDADPTVRALALRLARLSAGTGPAAVSALRGLGELLEAQRRSW